MSEAADIGADDVHLDHVGYIVRDLEASAELARQLGFVLTARADHTRTDAQGRSVPAGSAQHSIMLHSGYVELMQITDPDAGHQLASAPSQRHGLHVVAFGTGDAVACHARRTADGVQAGEVPYWSRPVHEHDLQGTARFAYFGSAWTARDPSYLCWVEHRTPGLLRNARLLAHDNRARALLGIRYAGPAAALAPWAEQLCAAGARLVHDEAGHKRLALPDASIEVVADARYASVLPQALLWGGADLDWLHAQCARLDLPCRRHEDGTLEIDLQSVLGMNWLFLPASTAA